MREQHDINGAQPKQGLEVHSWPDPDEHLWGDWMLNTSREGPTPATFYRVCLHPTCDGVEVKNA
jgi:hypothetical protein